jgi:hypothetical protein
VLLEGGLNPACSGCFKNTHYQRFENSRETNHHAHFLNVSVVFLLFISITKLLSQALIVATTSRTMKQLILNSFSSTFNPLGAVAKSLDFSMLRAINKNEHPNWDKSYEDYISIYLSQLWWPHRAHYCLTGYVNR